MEVVGRFKAQKRGKSNIILNDEKLMSNDEVDKLKLNDDNVDN